MPELKSRNGVAWRSVKQEVIGSVLRYSAGVVSRLRVWALRQRGVRVSGKCWIRRVSIPRNPWDILIESAALDDFVVLLSTGAPAGAARIIIGRGTYINRFTMIDASERIEIGSNGMIGPHCYITDHDHGTNPDKPIGGQPLVSQPVKIGDDVWIGAGASILKGVQVGDHAIIGAGAVVTKDVAPGMIVAGVPAQVIGSRNSESHL